MNDELKELSGALFTMRNGYLKSVVKGSVKNIESFIQAMEMVVVESGFLLSDDVSDNMATLFNMNKETATKYKENGLEARKKVLTNTKLIMDFIHKSDINKQFLDGYIKHIYSHFHYYQGNIINDHPFLTTPYFVKMLMEAFVIDCGGHLIASHYYVTDEESSSYRFNELFSLDFCMGLFTPDDAVEIPSNTILNLDYAGALNSGIKEAIGTYLDYAIKHEASVYESNQSYILTHPLDDEFSITLFLLKEYFRLKG